MKTTIITTIAGVSLLLAGSCSDEPFMNGNGAGDPTLPIILKAEYPTLTRVSDSGFEDGDRMGVFVLDYDGDNPEEIDGGPHASNVRFAFSAADNSWSGATDIYWTDASTPADLIAYYPFRDGITDSRHMPIEVERHQERPRTESSLGGYESSDFLYAKASRVMPTSEKVDLVFSHALAGLRVTLLAGNGFSASEWSETEKTVLFPEMVSGGEIDLATGVVVPDQKQRTSIIPVNYNEDFRAVTIPQTLPSGATAVALTVDGISYNLTKESAIELQPGKLHSFTITVNRKGEGGLEFKLTDESITPWLDNGEFRDGLIRQYTIIDVPQKGTLSQIVSEMNLELGRIYNLKLRGELDEQDFTFIRENIPNLKAINLYETTVYSEGRPHVIPRHAFFGKDVLSHVVFPRKLKEFGNGAFARTGLMGCLVIPEGVEKIGDNSELQLWGDEGGVFSCCRKLTGELSLPSTLKFVETGAFEGTGLSGSLSIPEGVTFIGARAFQDSQFSGELILPSRIETIGQSAFARCRFSGSLTVPQGLKILREWTFCYGFTGTLTIPEGVEQIEDRCFSGCKFVGELNLPSTLKRIGSWAFCGTRFSSVVFPEELLAIGAYAFEDCSRLSGTLRIPKNIEIIEDYTFSDCSMIDEIVIPKNVVRIKGGAFENCYNLSSIVCEAQVPPVLQNFYIEDDYNRPRAPFDGVPKDNFTLQVPPASVESYRSDLRWSEFRRIAPYSSFVCRPQQACALNTTHSEKLTLNAEGAWNVTHAPSWVTLSRTSGIGKCDISLTFKELPKGGGKRADFIEFTLSSDNSVVARCELSQYDYQYGEDECMALQRAAKGRGVDILFVGDAFDAEAIASGKYLEKVRRQYEDFFAVEPFATYRDYFNVYVCFSLSQDAGVNTANRWFNTRFQTYFASSVGCSVSGLACHEPDEVFDYAVSNSPLKRENMYRSLIIMTLNSDEYGSVSVITDSGAAIAIVGDSQDPYPMDSRGILQKEACGIAFGKLGDERARKVQYLSKGERETLRHYNDRGWFRNLSLDGNVRTVWWSWLAFDPRYSVNVDVFEGGLDKTRGCFRAEINSCMNFGIPYFSAAARYDMAHRIMDYAGEPFSNEFFLKHDSQSWGATRSTRAAGDFRSATVSFNNPTIYYKSKKY